MSFVELENQNPNIYSKSDERKATEEEQDESVFDEFDRREIFGKIRYIKNILFVAPQ